MVPSLACAAAAMKTVALCPQGNIFAAREARGETVTYTGGACVGIGPRLQAAVEGLCGRSWESEPLWSPLSLARPPR